VSGPLRWVDAVFDRRVNAAGRVRVLLELVERTLVVDLDEACVRLVRTVDDAQPVCSIQNGTVRAGAAGRA